MHALCVPPSFSAISWRCGRPPAKQLHIQTASYSAHRGLYLPPAGPLPPSWSALPRLEVLALHSNQLSGSLPSEWGGGAAAAAAEGSAGLGGSLMRLDLASNELEGGLPRAWGAMARLQQL